MERCIPIPYGEQQKTFSDSVGAMQQFLDLSDKHISRNSRTGRGRNNSQEKEESEALQQLVQVHEALLDSLDIHKSYHNENSSINNTNDNSNDGDLLQRSLLQSVAHDLDATLCWKALTTQPPNASWNHPLAAIQFLLRANQCTATARYPHHFTVLLIQLRQITLPFLLLVLPKYYSSADDPHCSMQKQLREELREVALTICFDNYLYYSKTTTRTFDEAEEEEQQRLLLQQCCLLCEEAVQNSLFSNESNNGCRNEDHPLLRLFVISSVGQILTRLYNAIDMVGSQQQIRNVIRNSVYTIVEKVLLDTLSKSNKSDSYWSCVVAELVAPICAIDAQQEEPPAGNTTNNNNNACMQNLWAHIAQILSVIVQLNHSENREDQQKLVFCCNEGQALSMTFNLLCVVVPLYLTQDIQLVTNDIRNGEKSSFVGSIRAQPLLWNALLYVLRTDHSSSNNNMDLRFAVADQVTRRRALYVMRLLVDSTTTNKNQNNTACCNNSKKNPWILWQKYYQVFDALELEMEQHLVNQAFPSLQQLIQSVVYMDEETIRCCYFDPNTHVPIMTWAWVGAVLSRLLCADNPKLRKLALHRFFHDDMGLDYSATTNSKCRRSIRIVDTSFVSYVLVPAFDSLSSSHTNVQYLQENSQQLILLENLSLKMRTFLEAFLAARLSVMDKTLDPSNAICKLVFSASNVQLLRPSTCVLVVNCLTKAVTSLQQHQPHFKFSFHPSTLELAVSFIQTLIQNSILVSYQKSLLRDLALLLRNSCCLAIAVPDPMLVLRVLSLYSTEKQRSEVEQETKSALVSWLDGLGAGWSPNAGAACASSFVSGTLSTDITGLHERLLGSSIAKLCALAKGDHSTLLWPAIYKGIPSTKPNTIDQQWNCVCSAEHTEKGRRAIILLEFGCLEGVLGGVGNGELVVMDSSPQKITPPPPPQIEELLGRSCFFLLKQMEQVHLKHDGLYENDDVREESLSSGAARIKTTMPTRMAQLGRQFLVLRQAFPSSAVLPFFAETLLSKAMNQLYNTKSSGDIVDGTKQMCCSFAALLCGATCVKAEWCNFLLELQYVPSSCDSRKHLEQARRSTFQYSKWGALSLMIPQVINQLSSKEPIEIRAALAEQTLESVFDSVAATPADALLPLFECAMASAEYLLVLKSTTKEGEKQHAITIQRIIRSLFAAANEMPHNNRRMNMLDQICVLLFRPKLVQKESQFFFLSGAFNGYVKDNFPIQSSFRFLMDAASSNKPHIARSAISRMVVAWLGDDELGTNSIMYRDDILALLTFKESKVDAATALQDISGTNDTIGFSYGFSDSCSESSAQQLLSIPSETHEMSVTRAFVLLFLSKLPDAKENNGTLQDGVLEMVHWLILKLLNAACALSVESKTEPHHQQRIGTKSYSERIRSWQALCLLNRFVTKEIAVEVCQQTLDGMGGMMHPQMRYFAEVFAIQCARRHPSTFATPFLVQLQRSDLGLQHISSLMIIGGNLVAGKYADEFLQMSGIDLCEMLAGVIPWLGGTQGFVRAIAQLLVHKIIATMELGGIVFGDSEISDNNWCVRRIKNFLDKNSEMKRLRSKQENFLENYDIDTACTAEGLMRLPIDDGNEVHPPHLIEAIKFTLKEVYDEAHENEAPTWRQTEELLRNVDFAQLEGSSASEIANFQRKIMPMDMLNLGIQEACESKHRNGAGKRKQDLIVCASMIDKVPNLAGLARTAEIFAAERLVIPDASVTKMDNFKSISVGANEWVEIEECREQVSLNLFLLR